MTTDPPAAGPAGSTAPPMEPPRLRPWVSKRQYRQCAGYRSSSRDQRPRLRQPELLDRVAPTTVTSVESDRGSMLVYARVARREGSDPQAIRDMAEDMKKQAAAGAPERVPAIGGTLLIDAENGKSMAIMLFESEEEMRRAHEVLDGQTSPRDTGGKRVSLEMFEVALDVRASVAST